MIAVDTSAPLAILLDEPEADACSAVLEREDGLLICAGAVAEALIVSTLRNVGEALTSLIDGLRFEVVTVTSASARRIASAYERWGKGVHPAGLDLGDGFAHEVANEHACRRLYVGDDVSGTDIQGAP